MTGTRTRSRRPIPLRLSCSHPNNSQRGRETGSKCFSFKSLEIVTEGLPISHIYSPSSHQFKLDQVDYLVIFLPTVVEGNRISSIWMMLTNIFYTQIQTSVYGIYE